MKYALFIAEKKENPSAEETTNWQTFLQWSSAKVEPTEGVTQISEGCYMSHLKNGLHGLSLLVEYAKQFHILSRTLFFDQEIPWVISS